MIKTIFHSSVFTYSSKKKIEEIARVGDYNGPYYDPQNAKGKLISAIEEQLKAERPKFVVLDQTNNSGKTRLLREISQDRTLIHIPLQWGVSIYHNERRTPFTHLKDSISQREGNKEQGKGSWSYQVNVLTVKLFLLAHVDFLRRRTAVTASWQTDEHQRKNFSKLIWESDHLISEIFQKRLKQLCVMLELGIEPALIEEHVTEQMKDEFSYGSLRGVWFVFDSCENLLKEPNRILLEANMIKVSDLIR